MHLSEVKGPMIDLSKVEGAMDPILTVRVALSINNAEKIVFVDVFSDTKCVSWLMEQVVQKAWESYGYEPIIYALRTEESGELNPQDLIIETINGNFERVDALYEGFREKTLSELYHNACVREHVSPNRNVELALENQVPGELLLSDACKRGINCFGSTVTQSAHALAFRPYIR
ncbi:hypothetical protein BJV82DRAFT_277618 [Fennellomyces sp. T-0311]|nr:hypothetical protein BJV82DRAFT_277618 [Fennellomyces sp. T-0311]